MGVGMCTRSSEISSAVGVAWMQGFWTLHGFEELINYWDWFLVGSSWIWGCFLGFYSAWIPGLAEAGILSVCWWPCPSVEVDLLGLPGCRLLLSGCMSQLTLAPAA